MTRNKHTPKIIAMLLLGLVAILSSLMSSHDAGTAKGPVVTGRLTDATTDRELSVMESPRADHGDGR